MMVAGTSGTYDSARLGVRSALTRVAGARSGSATSGSRSNTVTVITRMAATPLHRLQLI